LSPLRHLVPYKRVRLDSALSASAMSISLRSAAKPERKSLHR